MTRRTLSAFGFILVMLALVPAWYGCGLDPPDKPIPPPPLPKMPPESPQDVLDNMVYSYNQMDYERYYPLIHENFIFVFNEDDVLDFPDDIPQSGVWGQPEEIASAENMLDRNFIPDDPSLKIENMQLDLQFSGDLVPSNLVDPPPPPGTLEGFVTFDLRVQTIGEIDYLVNSRPLFFFTPSDTTIAGTDTTLIWSIWRIRDAPFGPPRLAAKRARED